MTIESGGELDQSFDEVVRCSSFGAWRLALDDVRAHSTLAAAVVERRQRCAVQGCVGVRPRLPHSPWIMLFFLAVQRKQSEYASVSFETTLKPMVYTALSPEAAMH